MNEILKSHLKSYRSLFNDKNQNTISLKKYIYNKEIKIDFSVVIPVHNQENIIVNNIKSIIDNIGGTFEIIIILDYCKDNSKQYIVDYFEKYINKNNEFYGITIYSEDTIPLFEASCDNIGFIFSKGKYCLEIQSDMEMTQKKFNLELEKPFKILDNVIAVSGRCAHSLFNHGKGIGKLGTDIEKSVSDLNIQKNIFYTFGTCNRGPLLIEKKKLQELSYLDEKNYYLENSDHDLMYRALAEKGYICGYVPIDFKSPLAYGTDRRKRDTVNEKISQIRIKERTTDNTVFNSRLEAIWIRLKYFKKLTPQKYFL